MGQAGRRFIAIATSTFLLAFEPVAARSHSHSQVQAPPTARETGKSEREVIPVSATAQTDVIVLDRNGRFVEGIPKESFEVLLDGRPQPVTYFESVEAGSPVEEAQWAKAHGQATLPSSQGSTGTEAGGRAVLFFVDDLHLSEASLAALREELTRYIDTRMGPGERAVVVAASKRIGFLQQLTRDKSALRTAVSQLAFIQPSTRDQKTPPMSEAQAAAIEDDDPAALDPLVKAILEQGKSRGRDGYRRAEQGVRQRASSVAAASARVSELMLSYLAASLRCFAEAPGRKVAFFLSDGFYLRDRMSNSVDWTLQSSDIAVAGRIAIYTLNARSLAASKAKTAPADVPASRPGAGEDADASVLQRGLGLLAISTGGRHLRNPSSLVDAVSSTLAETSHYYLIGWRFDPAIVRSGNSKALKVIVKDRPDLKVQLRQSSVDLDRFLAGAGGGADTAADRLLNAIRAPKPLSDLPVYLYCGHVRSADKNQLLTVTLQTTREFAQTDTGQAQRDVSVEWLGVVLSEKGLTVDGFQGTFPYPPQLQTVEFTYTRAVAAAPGVYQARASTRDPESGRTGSAVVQCEVPEFPAESLSLSSIFLVFSPSVPSSTTEPLPLTLSPGSVSGVRVNAKRRFAPGSVVPYAFYLYSPQPLTDGQITRISVRPRIYRGETELALELPQPATETLKTGRATLRYTAQLPLAGLAAGSYTLEITANDSITNQSAKQRLAFRIE